MYASMHTQRQACTYTHTYTHLYTHACFISHTLTHSVSDFLTLFHTHLHTYIQMQISLINFVSSYLINLVLVCLFSFPHVGKKFTLRRNRNASTSTSEVDILYTLKSQKTIDKGMRWYAQLTGSHFVIYTQRVARRYYNQEAVDFLTLQFGSSVVVAIAVTIQSQDSCCKGTYLTPLAVTLI